jgi:hypothetical protein
MIDARNPLSQSLCHGALPKMVLMGRCGDMIWNFVVGENMWAVDKVVVVTPSVSSLGHHVLCIYGGSRAAVLSYQT